MAKINCQNKNPEVKAYLRKMEKVALLVLADLGKSEAEINIVFMTNRAIRSLNKKYLGADKTTDVIAFWENSSGFPSSDGTFFMGDIAISSDKAVENSREFGVGLKRELALYVIHGVLHLAGYDDLDARNKKRMERKQNELLERCKKILQ